MTLTRFNLDASKSYKHFLISINNTNEISRKLFTYIDLKKEGIFFTILPQKTEINKIHNFKEGGITKNLQYEISLFLYKKMKKNKKSFLIFDDPIENLSAVMEYDLYIANGIHLKNEVYYALKSKKTISPSKIQECLQASDVTWHCLGILTNADLDKVDNKELKNEMIQEIYTKAELIITTAYDGEGYIFWERAKPD